MNEGLTNLLLILGGAWLLWEIGEHLLLPLYFVIRGRRQPPFHALEGRQARVISWQGNTGQVMINGEIWWAKAREELAVDEMVLIHKMDGLTLNVARPAGQPLNPPLP